MQVLKDHPLLKQIKSSLAKDDRNPSIRNRKAHGEVKPVVDLKTGIDFPSEWTDSSPIDPQPQGEEDESNKE